MYTAYQPCAISEENEEEGGRAAAQLLIILKIKRQQKWEYDHTKIQKNLSVQTTKGEK